MIDFPTITLLAAMSAIGIVAGFTAALLGVAQLTCEHGTSPWVPRISTVLLTMIAGYTAIDSWEVWAGGDETLDTKAIAFCVALALSWGYRRTFGFTSHRQARPPG